MFQGCNPKRPTIKVETEEEVLPDHLKEVKAGGFCSVV